MKTTQNRSCSACNKTFSKAEHLTRHLRSHTKERPYQCSVCGKVYSRSDVLRRHERSHQTSSPVSPEQPDRNTTMFTPLSLETPNSLPLTSDYSSTVPQLDNPPVGVEGLHSMDLQPLLGDPNLNGDSSSWFFGTGLDVDALDFSLSSAVSEWAQLPPRINSSSESELFTYPPPSVMPSDAMPRVSQEPPTDHVRQQWFTRLAVNERVSRSKAASNSHGKPVGLGNVTADENYRARLSQTLQPRLHDENLPSSTQLNLFASLFFSRFHYLLPIIHVPSFKPTMETSLLFVSICSIGSLFVGSISAVAQGTRLFERLNKAILVSWESILSQSSSNALSMVQAAVLGQTFAILSGNSKALVLADVLHGTVMAWARESDKNTRQVPHSPESLDLASADLEEQWGRWVEHEQRRRVEIALNIHDAELANLMHHEPLRKHRLAQYPHISTDELFAAPTALRWAELYKESSTQELTFIVRDNVLRTTVTNSNFSAYAVLESINALVIEARHSRTLDEHESRRFSNILMQWWRFYINHFPLDRNCPFNLPVLWHLAFISIYANIDLLEQASGRDGTKTASSSIPLIRSWAASPDSSRCLVHALLIQRYLEQMRVSSEPAIHVPRGLFTAALAWFCFTRVGGGNAIDVQAFDAPELQLVGVFTGPHDLRGQSVGEAADVGHLHRLIDLLGRFRRWGISETFSSVLCAVLESKQSG
ncbi:hypothetical protein BJX64DRAFT_296459 [Aspergillus heterothallicus]